MSQSKTIEGKVRRMPPPKCWPAKVKGKGDFWIFSIDTPQGHQLKMTGNFDGEIEPHAQIKAEGKVTHHPRYGKQFEFRKLDVQEDKAQNEREIITGALLSSMGHGVGAKTLYQVVDHFGPEQVIDVLNNRPEALTKVHGIGKVKAQTIIDSWHEKGREQYHQMQSLYRMGLKGKTASRVLEQLHDRAQNGDVAGLLERNPYEMVRVEGIGFLTADRAGLRIGIQPDAPERIQAALRHTVDQFCDDVGHTAIPYSQLIASSGELLNKSTDEHPVTEEQIAPVLAGEVEQKELISLKRQRGELPDGVSEDRVSPPWLYHAERKIADRLKGFQDPRNTRSRIEIDEVSPSYRGIKLADRQVEAVRTALQEPVSILTGGPGTGKTTITRAICEKFQEQRGNDAQILAMAPTGKAAQQLSQATGLEAGTIHRMLGLRPGQPPRHDANNPLPVDMVVIDEFSMVDARLANALFQAIPSQAKVLIVGDKDQLPSVGPGNVLNDLIESRRIPVSRLNQIHRQQEGEASDVAQGAAQIRNGRKPQFGGDFQFHRQEEATQAADAILDQRNRLKRENPGASVRILCTKYDSAVGVNELNRRVQEAVNPDRGQGRIQKSTGEQLREGDEVMQTRNNYDIGWDGLFNGDMGVIEQIRGQDVTLRVNGRSEMIDAEDLEDMRLAYAITAHKSQGSQEDHIVMSAVGQDAFMLDRTLFYTAVTRAKATVQVVGRDATIGGAVRKNNQQARSTNLMSMLSDRLQSRASIEHQEHPAPARTTVGSETKRPVDPSETAASKRTNKEEGEEADEPTMPGWAAFG